MDDPYAAHNFEAPSDIDFKEATTEHSTSIHSIQSNTMETVKRTHFILDLILGFISILLLLYSINVFLVAVTRIAIFNSGVPSGKPSDWPTNLRRIVAGTRFVAASGIIGSFLSFCASILGLVTVVMRIGAEKLKMVRVGLLGGFVALMVCLLTADTLSCIVAAAVNFRYDNNLTNATGAGWLLIGGQVLIVFHCSIIAFAILRIVYWLKH